MIGPVSRNREHVYYDPLFPLWEFYPDGIHPSVALISPNDLPDPYRALLVHDKDMTPTLERHHGGPISLRLLGSQRSGSVYKREVILVLEPVGKPVEFGAIRIHLSRFPLEARMDIVENRMPLGTILKKHRVEHKCRPSAFFKAAPDTLMREALASGSVPFLFGRCNTMTDGRGLPLAEVVEILPPAEMPAAQGALDVNCQNL
ncbi:MAG: hypothetical protein HUU16_22165 [Candidatus Omnitrophica bacterium]|nr:hypothetical protein [bacterium]NUN98866.1 hypothetical protein [Candidatus Omnitrophota bacterium]